MAMWMLTAILCLDLGHDIEYRRYSRPPVKDSARCGELRLPLREYLEWEAEQLGARIVKLEIECWRRRDG